MFLINLQGKETIYEQIKTQIVRFIDVGVLKPNDKLPTVRKLADDLHINPNTVMKAYQELEKAGFIYMLNKKGAFVADKSLTSNKEIEARKLISVLKDSGLKKEELLEVIEKVYMEEDDVRNK